MQRHGWLAPVGSCTAAAAAVTCMQCVPVLYRRKPLCDGEEAPPKLHTDAMESSRSNSLPPFIALTCLELACSLERSPASSSRCFTASTMALGVNPSGRDTTPRKCSIHSTIRLPNNFNSVITQNSAAKKASFGSRLVEVPGRRQGSSGGARLRSHPMLSLGARRLRLTALHLAVNASVAISVLQQAMQGLARYGLTDQQPNGVVKPTSCAMADFNP